MTNSVNVSGGNQSSSINVSSGTSSGDISFVNNAAWHWSEVAKQWAISETLVEGEDYSSKHYAQISQAGASIITDNIDGINAILNNVETINAVASDLTNIDNASAYANLSKDWANKTSGTVDGVEYSAKYYAEQAQRQVQSNWNETSSVSPAYIQNKPTNVSDFTNDVGYITGITSSDVTTALGYTPGTVTSVNNVQPVNGNVTIDALPSQTGNPGKYLTTDGTNASWGDLSTRNIGEIVTSTIPLTDAGLHLLDGALIQYGSYSAFVDYIAGLVTDYPNLFCTEADWQASVTQYGVCGKFVYDSVNNTVKLPKITGIIEGTTDVTALGDLVEAGLPNIRTSPSVVRGIGIADDSTIDPPFYYIDNIGTETGGSTTTRGVGFDASLSNPIYGNSPTVQPQTIKVLYYIVIATSTKTDIQVDIDEIATDLNGKADVDLTNVNNQGKILMSRMGMPSSTYTALTVGASGSTYTAPANGWVIVRCGSDRSNYYIYLQNDTNGFEVNPTTGTPTPFGVSAYIPVNKGDVFRLSYQNVHFDFFRFYYAVGSESEA